MTNEIAEIFEHFKLDINTDTSFEKSAENETDLTKRAESVCSDLNKIISKAEVSNKFSSEPNFNEEELSILKILKR